MAHELAGALQQAGRIRQRCTVKEPHVDVRSEYIDVPEGRIAQTCNRTAVMQDLPDFVPAFSHHLKPLIRDGSQFTSVPFHPRIDGGIAFDSTVESQQFRSHRRPIFAFGSMLRGTPTRATKGVGPQKRPCIELTRSSLLISDLALPPKNRFLDSFRVADDRCSINNTLGWWLLVCGPGKQKQIPIRIFDDEILGAPGLLFQRLVKGNPTGLKFKKQ